MNSTKEIVNSYVYQYKIEKICSRNYLHSSDKYDAVTYEQ